MGKQAVVKIKDLQAKGFEVVCNDYEFLKHTLITIKSPDGKDFTFYSDGCDGIMFYCKDIKHDILDVLDSYHIDYHV